LRLGWFDHRFTRGLASSHSRCGVVTKIHFKSPLFALFWQISSPQILLDFEASPKRKFFG